MKRVVLFIMFQVHMLKGFAEGSWHEYHGSLDSLPSDIVEKCKQAGIFTEQSPGEKCVIVFVSVTKLEKVMFTIHEINQRCAHVLYIILYVFTFP